MTFLSFSSSYLHFFFFFILRSFSFSVILFSDTVSADPILRDIEDSFGEDVCLAESPTIARDLAETRPQQCVAHREIVPPSNRLIRSKVVYESRRVSTKGCRFYLKTVVYDSFAKRWQSSPAFLHSESSILVDVTSYTRGKLFILEFENCWFLVKIYGMDALPPTPIGPSVRSSTARLSTRVLSSTTQLVTSMQNISTRAGSTTRTMRTIRSESRSPLMTLTTRATRVSRRTTSFVKSTSRATSIASFANTTPRATTTTSFLATTSRASSIGVGTTSASVVTSSSTTRGTSSDIGSTVPTSFTTVPATSFSTGKRAESTSRYYISTANISTVARWVASTTATPSMDNRLVLALSTVGGIAAFVSALVVVYCFCIFPRRRIADGPDNVVAGPSIDRTNDQTDGQNNDGVDLEMEGADETEMTILDSDVADNTSIGSVMSHIALIDDIVF